MVKIKVGLELLAGERRSDKNKKRLKFLIEFEC